MTATATPTLVDFLLARIAEDEEAARAATRAEDVFVASYHGDTAAEYALGLAESEGADQRVVQHYARHDPARVLAECAAKRAVVALGPSRCSGADDEPLGIPGLAEWTHYPDEDYAGHCDGCSSAEAADHQWMQTLRLLAQPYASHPDFRAEWSA